MEKLILKGETAKRVNHEIAATSVLRVSTEIHPVEFDARAARIVMGGTYVADRPLGPAAQWLIRYLPPS